MWAVSETQIDSRRALAGLRRGLMRRVAGSHRMATKLAVLLETRSGQTPLGGAYDWRITTRRIHYGLAAMVALLVGGTIIGFIWADTSDLAGGFAVVTNIVGVVGVVIFLGALAVTRRRRRS